jgi:hypothetical protein
MGQAALAAATNHNPAQSFHRDRLGLFAFLGTPEARQSRKEKRLWQTTTMAISSETTRSFSSINCGTEKWVKNIFPKIGGRLRLAHEENAQLWITTEIIKYDENLAVGRAITTTMKGNFSGLGMSSVDRDHTIANAILELLETRAWCGVLHGECGVLFSDCGGGFNIGDLAAWLIWKGDWYKVETNNRGKWALGFWRVVKAAEAKAGPWNQLAYELYGLMEDKTGAVLGKIVGIVEMGE